MSKDEAESRLAAQWPLEKKKDLASQVLDNNGNQNQLLNQVHILLEGGRQDDEINWKDNLRIAWFGNFLTGASISLVVPFMPIFVENLGVGVSKSLFMQA